MDKIDLKIKTKKRKNWERKDKEDGRSEKGKNKGNWKNWERKDKGYERIEKGKIQKTYEMRKEW